MSDWDALYARVAADTGWTFEQVGRLTLPRYLALYREFRRAPPVRWLLAGFVGYRAPDENKGPVIKPEDLIPDGAVGLSADMLAGRV